jgi:hypothetical protein
MPTIDKLPEGSHKYAGFFDNAGRWEPYDEYNIPGTFIKVRPPSRQWPYSYLKHFYTKKYAKKLAEAKPMAYMFLAGLKPESERGKQLIAMHAANRMRCGSQYAGEGAHG